MFAIKSFFFPADLSMAGVLPGSAARSPTRDDRCGIILWETPVATLRVEQANQRD
jgi:hypothetical protein